MIEGFGIEDPDRLQRRYEFLVGRAKAAGSNRRDRSPRPFEVAIAATLMREAAAIAVVMGADPMPDLARAANYYAELGLSYGAMLFGLAGERDGYIGVPSRSDLLDYLDWRLDDQRGLAGAGDDRRPPGPFAEAASRTPRQWLHARQAVALGEDRRAAFSQRLEAHLAGVRSPPVAGLSTGTYLRLMVAAESDAAGLGVDPRVAPKDAGPLLRSAIAARYERIDAARADTHRWRQGLGAAEIIDFDLVALCAVLIRSDTFRQMVEEAFDGQDPLVCAPFNVAGQRVGGALA
jgi:hypothetical protein